jgi:murein DD-endopeptidase MepM/ murein hydrolase activator NlpD
MKALCLLVQTVLIVLLGSATVFANDLEQFNSLIRRYSSQQIVTLNLNETYTFTLNNGATRLIRLLKVAEQCDSVVRLIRSAEVDITIDGKPVRLLCVPFGMPTEIQGLRIQVDTTSKWLGLLKRTQFSLWDATDPIVNTGRFAFPLDHYAFFSHGMQGYNEVVHLGWKDGCPKGVAFYHNYGVDFAGYEAKHEVLSCTDGTVLSISTGQNNYVVIEDPSGLIWKYGHLASLEDGVKPGYVLSKGAPLGRLGKTGPSGNFAHLHVGTFLSRTDFKSGNNNRRFNLYPWLVVAYQRQNPHSLYAVARPHRTVSTHETVQLDASNSILGRNDKVSYRWVLPDGRISRQKSLSASFANPGVYLAELWLKNAQGYEDVDFLKIRVFTQATPEDSIPTIFMTYYPAKDIQVNDPIAFRVWWQGIENVPLTIDFGDGKIIKDYQSYTEVSHRFTTTGIHIVTAHGRVNGHPITQKLKVRINAEN